MNLNFAFTKSPLHQHVLSISKIMLKTAYENTSYVPFKEMETSLRNLRTFTFQPGVVDIKKASKFKQLTAIKAIKGGKDIKLLTRLISRLCKRDSREITPGQSCVNDLFTTRKTCLLLSDQFILFTGRDKFQKKKLQEKR